MNKSPSPQTAPSESPLTVALGRNDSGCPFLADIAKMPHALVAGSNGTEILSCIHNILLSILGRARPDEVRLILIGSQAAELSAYDGVAHLLAPAISAPALGVVALDWAVAEMERRHVRFIDSSVRNRDAYNSRLPEGEKPMPQILIVVSELADLMGDVRKDAENNIARLAMMGRAAGIHLILATQHPSAEVLTGLIRANIPARIAFRTGSASESCVILDRPGAESLSGDGEMLYAPPGGQPMRLHSSAAGSDDVADVVESLKGRYPLDYDAILITHMSYASLAPRRPASSDDDQLQEAIGIALDRGEVSCAMLQRRMRISYSRAMRLMEELCRQRIAAEADGAHPRKVLISWEEYEEYCRRD